MAKAYGITVIDSTPLLRELCPYRRPDDPWHFAGSRYEDYGLTLKWQLIVQSAQGVACYARVPDDLRVGLASIPTLPLEGEAVMTGTVGKPVVVVLHEPARTFVSVDQLLLTPCW